MALKPAIFSGIPLVDALGRPLLYDDSDETACDCCCLTCAQFWEHFSGVDLSYSGGRDYTFDGCPEVEPPLDSSTQRCLGSGLNASLTLGPGVIEGDIGIDFGPCSGPLVHTDTPCDSNTGGDCLYQEYLGALLGNVSCSGGGDVSISLAGYFTHTRTTGTECDGMTFPCCAELGFTLGECATGGPTFHTMSAAGEVDCIRESEIGELIGCCNRGPQCLGFLGKGSDCDDPDAACGGAYDVGEWSILLG